MSILLLCTAITCLILSFVIRKRLNQISKSDDSPVVIRTVQGVRNSADEEPQHADWMEEYDPVFDNMEDEDPVDEYLSGETTPERKQELIGILRERGITVKSNESAGTDRNPASDTGGEHQQMPPKKEVRETSQKPSKAEKSVGKESTAEEDAHDEGYPSYSQARSGAASAQRQHK